jgi:hypothetical protein
MLEKDIFQVTRIAMEYLKEESYAFEVRFSCYGFRNSQLLVIQDWNVVLERELSLCDCKVKFMKPLFHPTQERIGINSLPDSMRMEESIYVLRAG